MPEAQPKAREDAGAVVLPEMSGGTGGTSSGQTMKILCIHGWNSVVGGVKPTYLKSHGHEVIEPALHHEDFQAAVETAQAAFDQHQPDVVVGSSRGGAVAVNINSGMARLVLICPAWKKCGTAKSVKPGTVILHSRADEVVPFQDGGLDINEPTARHIVDRGRPGSQAGRPGAAGGTFAGGGGARVSRPTPTPTARPTRRLASCQPRPVCAASSGRAL